MLKKVEVTAVLLCRGHMRGQDKGSSKSAGAGQERKAS